jgi:hypothetical protein
LRIERRSAAVARNSPLWHETRHGVPPGGTAAVEPTPPPPEDKVAVILKQLESNPYAWVLDLTNRQIY